MIVLLLLPAFSYNAPFHASPLDYPGRKWQNRQEEAAEVEARALAEAEETARREKEAALAKAKDETERLIKKKGIEERIRKVRGSDSAGGRVEGRLLHVFDMLDKPEALLLLLVLPDPQPRESGLHANN